MRLLAILPIVLLAACQSPPNGTTATDPDHSAGTPKVETMIAVTGRSARDLVERLGAGCWLDGIVGGAGMVVDRGTGQIIIVSDTEDLLRAEFLGTEEARSRLRLSGPVVGDLGKQARLLQTLDRAVRTGETTCPRIVS